MKKFKVSLASCFFLSFLLSAFQQQGGGKEITFNDVGRGPSLPDGGRNYVFQDGGKGSQIPVGSKNISIVMVEPEGGKGTC